LRETAAVARPANPSLLNKLSSIIKKPVILMASDVREELAERARQYIDMVSEAVKQAEEQVGKLRDDEKRVVHLARLYLQDSAYYFEKGDYVTALATVSYAEGLLDSLSHMGKLEIAWKKRRPRKVLVAGTFDLLHPGHVMFLKEASKLGDLYVIVSRDSNAERIKGRPVVIGEASRALIVGSLKYVKEAVLGDEEDMLKRVAEISPDIIVLGPDQPADENQLKEELARRGLGHVQVIRFERRLTTHSPSSSRDIIERVKQLFCRE